MNKYSPKRPPHILPNGTIELQLTQSKTSLIDAIDADLAELKWCAHKVHCCIYCVHNTYDTETKKRGRLSIHRIILSRMLGHELVTYEQVDHISGDSLDNRRSNLRLANNAENNRNKGLSTRNRCGLKGVVYHADRQKWAAYIKVNKKTLFLGRFNTPQLAHQAYCEAAVKHFGEFARFN